MNVIRVWKVTLLALCGGLVIVSGVSYAGENNMMVFHEYLTQVGDKLDCYFTVESVGQTGYLNNPILDAMVDVDVKAVQDLNSVIMSLANDIPIVWKAENMTNRIGLVVDKIDLERPIVRIRDVRLTSVKHYALDEQMSIEYSGTLDGLLSSLSSRNSLIQRQRVVSVGMGPIVVDVQTQARVAARDKAIRDILTMCTPISRYSRVIWSSYTNGKEESPSVTIKFYGARKK
ncbi:MAG: hypothetical protein WC299_13950 [Kiritimatiellia bacterium]